MRNRKGEKQDSPLSAGVRLRSVLDSGEFLGVVARHLPLQLSLDAREGLALGLGKHNQHENQPQQRERTEAPEYCVDSVRVLYNLKSKTITINRINNIYLRAKEEAST